MNKRIFVSGIIILSQLTISCAGMKEVSGPEFRDDTLLRKDIGHIIIFQPLAPTMQRNLHETDIYLNAVKTSALNYGGYHLYKVKPGLHIINARHSRGLDESIAFDIKPSETVYIKYLQNIEKQPELNLINQIHKDEAIPELRNTKLQYVTDSPIAPLSLDGKSLIAKRNSYLSLEHTEANDEIFAFLYNPSSTFSVSSGFNTFNVKMSYTTYGYGTRNTYSTDNKNINLETKGDCIYLIKFNKKDDKVNFYTDELC